MTKCGKSLPEMNGGIAMETLQEEGLNWNRQKSKNLPLGVRGRKRDRVVIS